MRKNILGMILVIFVAGTSFVSADEIKGSMGRGMTGKGMMGKGKIGGKMMMHGMMKSMMERTVLTTADGGIIIVQGNKLTKYDKNLNVIKEVELKTDFDSMHGMMRDMMEKCPMMKPVMDKEEETSAEDTEESDESEHESHH